MKNPKRALITSLIGFFVIVILAAVAVYMSGAQAVDYMGSQMKKTEAPAIVPVEDSTHPAEMFNGAGSNGAVESAPVAPAAPQTNTQPTPKPAAPQPQAAQPEGGHIPFTSEPVTPGVPESYVDTVGQCPFYEIAGLKGCLVPKDIECNSDWTICKYLGK